MTFVVGTKACSTQSETLPYFKREHIYEDKRNFFDRESVASQHSFLLLHLGAWEKSSKSESIVFMRLADILIDSTE